MKNGHRAAKSGAANSVAKHESCNNFLAKMFMGRARGNLIVCSYANERDEAKTYPPRHIVVTPSWPEAAEQISKFVEKYDKPGRAIYFGCNTIRGRKRGKDEVQEIGLAYCDVDLKGIQEDPETVITVLKDLKLKPSVTVFSGHGYHPYWLLDKPLDATEFERHEELLRRLAEVLAGDIKAAETARVLRVPGSHNTKDGEHLDVFVVDELSCWEKYSIEDLEAWLEETQPLLKYKPKEKVSANGASSNVYQLFDLETRPIDKQLADMIYHGVRGDGIDDTFSRVIGRMVKYATLEEVLEKLHDPTQLAHKRGRVAGNSSWSEKKFEVTVTEMYERFSKQDAAKEEKLESEFSSDSPLYDPWEEYPVPPFPKGILPPWLETFANAMAKNMGVGSAEVSMAILVAISGAISHKIKLKFKKHGKWRASPRLWLLFSGDASTRKTPIFDEILEPFETIAGELSEAYRKEFVSYKKLTPEEQKETDPPTLPPRYVVYDSTPEKLGVVIAANPKGLIAKRDEMSGWIADLERYGNSSARGFYLKAFDGGPYGQERIGRNDGDMIENLSLSIIGGIQPRKLAEIKGLTSDGLLQRFIVVVLRAQLFNDDCPVPSGFDEFIKGLIDHHSGVADVEHKLSEDAYNVMRGIDERLFNLSKKATGIAEGFGEHVGKLSGLAGSLALLLHYAHFPDDIHPRNINADIVEKIERLIFDFILPHALEFYQSYAREGSSGETMQKVASWILTEKCVKFTASDLTRNVSNFRGLDLFTVNKKLSPLIAVGWIKPHAVGPDNKRWTVEPRVPEEFAERAALEEKRKRELAKLMNAKRHKRS